MTTDSLFLDEARFISPRLELSRESFFFVSRDVLSKLLEPILEILGDLFREVSTGFSNEVLIDFRDDCLYVIDILSVLAAFLFRWA